MKKLYNLLLALICTVVALSFLPWIYTIMFPAETTDPFVAYSPVSNSFVVSQSNGEGSCIFTVDADGNIIADGFTKNDRDPLLPQLYFTQLSSRSSLPDTVAGKNISIPILKNSQWVFSSVPREINRAIPGVYPIMESRPKRVELEDPTEVFTLYDRICFIDMETNSEYSGRSQRFACVFAARNFQYPARWASANITARKSYDDGYLLIDNDSQLFHMKMQAGQPYLVAIDMPHDALPQYAFILENPDMQYLGLVTTTNGDIYAIDRANYQPIKLPLNNIDPSRQRIVIMKNLFNWVVKITDKTGTRWVAIDSDNHTLLGDYRVVREDPQVAKIARWIFPFTISFTDVDDCFAWPRLANFSPKATTIWLLLFLTIYFLPKLIKSKKQ